MEAKDIWILLIGTGLGFIASLLATFTAPSISNTFDKLKFGVIERNKTKALAAYMKVLPFKFGRRDKYLYAINGWGLVSFLTFGGISAGVIGLTGGILLHFSGATIQGAATVSRFLFFPVLIIATMVVVIFGRCLRLLLTLYRVSRRAFASLARHPTASRMNADMDCERPGPSASVQTTA